MRSERNSSSLLRPALIGLAAPSVIQACLCCVFIAVPKSARSDILGILTGAGWLALIPVILLIVGGITGAAIRVRTLHRRASGRCEFCAYFLGELSRCPECGQLADRQLSTPTLLSRAPFRSLTMLIAVAAAVCGGLAAASIGMMCLPLTYHRVDRAASIGMCITTAMGVTVRLDSHYAWTLFAKRTGLDSGEGKKTASVCSVTLKQLNAPASSDGTNRPIVLCCSDDLHWSIASTALVGIGEESLATALMKYSGLDLTASMQISHLVCQDVVRSDFPIALSRLPHGDWLLSFSGFGVLASLFFAVTGCLMFTFARAAMRNNWDL